MRGRHLRDLFAEDPARGERMTAEAAGVFLDYSKNRVEDETLSLLVELAEQSGLRERIDAMFRGEKINVTENRAVLHGCPIAEPYNLGRGWVGFDFAAAFGRPVKVVNDAAMQALGSYNGGKMLFLGLGTGLGSTLIMNGIVEPMELGHLPYKKGTYEDYVGRAGLERHGKKKWRRYVADVVARFITALEPDDTVIGGGNVKKLDRLPPHSRAGDNANAFRGGFCLWQEEHARPRTGARSKPRT